MSDPTIDLKPYQYRDASGQILETADQSPWLFDPFTQTRLTHARVRDLVHAIQQQHAVKLVAAYEILGRAMGYKTYGALKTVLDRQMPDSDILRVQTRVRMRRQKRQDTKREDLRRGANEVHDDLYGKNQHQPSARSVTRTGHFVDGQTRPLDRNAVQVVYRAGPETRNRARRTKE